MLKKYNQFINEKFRGDLEIPFDGKHPLHDKHVFTHIVDALIDLSKQGTKFNADDFSSSEEVRKLIDENFDDAYKYYQRWEEADYLIDSFVYKIKEYSKYWKDYDSIKDEDSYDIAKSEGELLDLLTDEGIQEYENYCLEYFSEMLDMYGFTNWYYNPEDDNGLIDIWRAVSFKKGNFNDPYENIINHGGVGIYWSWEADGAEPHGDSWGPDTFVLHAKARPEDVNWVNTIYKNGSNLNEEREIEMKDGVPVMIVDISKGKFKKEFEKPYIVSV